MAISLSSLATTESNDPPIFCIYGVDGVGKTTLAAEFPDPVYISTDGERPPSDTILPTLGVVGTYEELLDNISRLLQEPHGFKTAIFDSIDGLEPLIQAATCKRIGATSIDDSSKDSPASFGRGYREADVEWNDYLAGLGALARAGIAVVQIGHPAIVPFNSPTSDPYSRYEIKTNKRAAAIVREKSDVVAFVNYRMSIKEKEQGFGKKAGHGEGGGDRLIHLEERPGFMAKNRYVMPPSIPYKKGHGYAALQKYFPAPTGVKQEK